jgi:hypothetical protein
MLKEKFKKFRQEAGLSQQEVATEASEVVAGGDRDADVDAHAATRGLAKKQRQRKVKAEKGNGRRKKKKGAA